MSDLSLRGSRRPPDRAPPAPRRESRLIAPFKFRDFRLLWIGLLISNLGTWMQITALGYYVVTLAPTPRIGAFYLGLVGLSQAIPVLLLSPVAGVVADTLPRRGILVLTNGAIVVLAALLGALVQFSHVGIAVVLVIAALSAAVRSFDTPARQSWVPLLVGREYVGNAIGLNSIAFNGPSVVGPAIAGFLIASVSIAGSFYVNAASTIAVIAALLMMRPAPPSNARREPLLDSIATGVRFLLTHPVLRWIFVVLIANSLLVRPYLQLLPAFALNHLHVGARGLGWLMAASGAGAIGGATITALFSSSSARAQLWFGAVVVASLGVALLGTVTAFPVAIGVLVVIGLGTLAFAGATNVIIQTLAPDEIRGRAISAFSMVVLGLVPTGSLLLGGLGTLVGLPSAFELGGLATAALALWVWAGHSAVRSA